MGKERALEWILSMLTDEVNSPICKLCLSADLKVQMPCQEGPVKYSTSFEGTNVLS